MQGIIVWLLKLETCMSSGMVDFLIDFVYLNIFNQKKLGGWINKQR